MKIVRPRRARPSWRATLIGVVLLAGLGARALGDAGETPADASRPVLSSLAALHSIPPGPAHRRFTLRLETRVCFYDPAWQLLWGEVAGEQFFTQPQNSLTIRAGDRIRLEGVVDPASLVRLADASAELIDQPGLPAAREFTDHLADPAALEGRLVSLEAEVDSQIEVDPGHLRLALRAAGRSLTGTVLLAPPAPVPQLEGTRIRVRGIYAPARDAAGRIERIDLWIPSTAAVEVVGPRTDSDGSPIRPRLHSVHQVMELPLARARLGYPVQLSGVVMWSDPASREFYLRDAGRGIRVEIPSGSALRPPPITTSILLTGTTSATSLAPIVLADAVENRGTLALPEPAVVTLEQVSDGRLEGQRVQLLGHLRSARIEDGRSVLEIATPAGDFTARLPAGGIVTALQGSVVRVSGVCVARLNERQQVAGIELLCASGDDVQVAEASSAMPVPSALPLLHSVRDFYALTAAQRERRYRVQFDVRVGFYDSSWNLLWGEEAGEPFFIVPGNKPLPIKAGQRVRLEGTVNPMGAFALEDGHATVLEDTPLPAPLETAGRFTDVAQFDGHVAAVEGYVDAQNEIDPTHLRLAMIVEGRLVTATVLIEPNAPIPQVQGALVRVRGVYVATRYPDGGIQRVDLWIPHAREVQVRGWLAADKRFAQPLTPLGHLADLPPGTAVRVHGIVRRFDAGQSITIRDDDTEIAVVTPQARGLQVGKPIEAIGVVRRSGVNFSLHDALWRAVANVDEEHRPSAPDARAKLRLASQVLELPPDQARLGYPVELRGVVIWSDPRRREFYVRDTSRAVRVSVPATSALRPPPVTTAVIVRGRTAGDDFAPGVVAETVERPGTSALPEPRVVTLEQALTGTEESQRIELTGFLRHLRSDDNYTYLDLTSSTGEFTGRIRRTDQLDNLRGAVVRIAGVCVAQLDERRQLTGVELLVATTDDVQIEDTAPADPFEVPAKTIASLREYGPRSALDRRVRTSGVVLQQVPGRYLTIQDGDDSLQALSRATDPLAPGDRVDVVGFPGREGKRIVLREAAYRRTGTGAEPAPTFVANPAAVNLALDGRLVELRGRLVDATTTDSGSRLWFQAGRAGFEALLPRQPERTPAPRLEPDSLLALRGVYRVQFDEFNRPSSFRLELRRGRDITLLEQPPVWTLGRALALCAALAGGFLLVFLWVGLLRRRVREQTEQIRAQVAQQAVLEQELQRASKLESLGVLAGGIAHDFNNLLTVVLGNLALALDDELVAAAAGDQLRSATRGAQRARDLTQQLLTFAKGGDPLRTAVSLSEVVRESAEFVLRGSKVGCDYDFSPGLWNAHADRGQIGQVVHNLVLNAIQAMPGGGMIRITLANREVAAGEFPGLAAGRFLLLTFADTGPGIAPDLLPRIFDPYVSTKKTGSGLGLATVYSIVRKHEGRIDVRSELGHGTTFQVWLPATDAAPAAPPAEKRISQQRPLRGRVLVMDDEEEIRQMVCATLTRMGLAVKAVEDGALAVRTYASARQAGEPFDAVIMDLTVPGGMGGREAMAQLLEIDPGVRAIVSSGYSNDTILANYRTYGFCAMVAKPYDITDLAGTVARVISEGRAAPA